MMFKILKERRGRVIDFCKARILKAEGDLWAKSSVLEDLRSIWMSSLRLKCTEALGNYHPLILRCETKKKLAWWLRTWKCRSLLWHASGTDTFSSHRLTLRKSGSGANSKMRQTTLNSGDFLLPFAGQAVRRSLGPCAEVSGEHTPLYTAEQLGSLGTILMKRQ